MFYFVLFNGEILTKKLSQNYLGLEETLRSKRQSINDEGINDRILQMDLVIRMINIEQNLRPSLQNVLHHLCFWNDKKCLDFILEIRKNFDVLDPNFTSKIKDRKEYQKVVRETPNMQNLKNVLDLDKSVVYNDWTAKLDKKLTEEFNRSYNKESVSDLLRAMRNKVIISLNS